jgi:hypothetical protein
MFISEKYDWLHGLERVWKILLDLNPDDVCRRAEVDFDKSAGYYILPFFNERIFISPEQRRIWGGSWLVDLVLNELAKYSMLSVLWYLIHAKDIPLTGNLINPRELSGGLIFTSGSHMLPLNELTDKYACDLQSFIQRGFKHGAQQLSYGDACVKLFPFPRVPIVLLIWKQDEEFPARAYILLDSTCSEHLPTDIIWSTAMVSILVMLN